MILLQQEYERNQNIPKVIYRKGKKKSPPNSSNKIIESKIQKVGQQDISLL